jgi:hypothetical protein
MISIFRAEVYSMFLLASADLISWLIFRPEDGDNKYLRNVLHSSNCMAYNPEQF